MGAMKPESDPAVEIALPSDADGMLGFAARSMFDSFCAPRWA